MAENWDKGQMAEAICLKYMEDLGFSLVKSRLSSRPREGAGEIDLIVSKDKLLVFVEVKSRRKLGLAGEAISLRQQKRIVRAALLFISENPQFANYDLRFDAMLLTSGGKLPLHIPGAWEAEDREQ